jgi:hypothetical protein
MSAYIKRIERSQINDLIIHLKWLEKQEQSKPKTSRREIIEIRAEINELETIKNHTKDQWNEKLFLWKIDKIDKQLANLTKTKREKT